MSYGSNRGQETHRTGGLPGLCIVLARFSREILKKKSINMHKVVALVFLLLLVVIFWNYVEAAGKYFFIAKNVLSLHCF